MKCAKLRRLLKCFPAVWCGAPKIYSTPRVLLTADSVEERYQIWAILVGYRGKFQAYSTAWGQVPHFRLNSYISLLDQKMELGFNAYRLRNRRGEEQSTDTQVGNTHNVFGLATAPTGPHTVRYLDSRTQSSGINQF